MANPALLANIVSILTSLFAIGFLLKTLSTSIAPRTLSLALNGTVTKKLLFGVLSGYLKRHTLENCKRQYTHIFTERYPHPFYDRIKFGFLVFFEIIIGGNEVIKGHIPLG